MITRHIVTVYTNAAGAGTGYTSGPVDGLIQAIVYQPGTIDTNGDVTITGEGSGIPIVTISNIGTSQLNLFPRAATATIANAASLYAAGGTAINDRIPVSRERVKVVVADGGNTMTGTFHVYLDA